MGHQLCCLGSKSLSARFGGLWCFEFGLGLVEGDVRDIFLRGGEIDDGLGRRVVTPGDDRVEVADEVLGQAGGEGFAVELGGEAGSEVLEHDEADEEGVARRP